MGCYKPGSRGPRGMPPAPLAALSARYAQVLEIRGGVAIEDTVLEMAAEGPRVAARSLRHVRLARRGGIEAEDRAREVERFQRRRDALMLRGRQDLRGIPKGHPADGQDRKS